MKPPRQKDYPKEFYIGGCVYELKFRRCLPDGDFAICGDDGVIEISQKKNRDPRERLKSLIHEMLHAIEYAHQIKIDHKTIHELEDPICDFILDNF